MKIFLLLIATFFPSTLRIALFRALGFKVGKNAKISPMSLIVAREMEIGSGAIIQPFSFIYSPSRFTVGERSRIAAFVRIVGGGEFNLGHQAFLGLGSLVDVTTEFRVGDRSQLGPKGLYYSHGASGLIFNMRFPHRNAPIVIGKDCWIGMGCTIYPGVRVGDRSLVLPRITLHKDILADSAVVPPKESFQVLPTSAFTAAVTDEDLNTLLKRTLERVACERPDLAKGISLDPKVESDVLWTLRRRSEALHATQFVFEEFRIYGGSSLKTEKLAVFLAENCGIYFRTNGEGSNLTT